MDRMIRTRQRRGPLGVYLVLLEVLEPLFQEGVESLHVFEEISPHRLHQCCDRLHGVFLHTVHIAPQHLQEARHEAVREVAHHLLAVGITRLQFLNQHLCICTV